jgi:hypothetical protein
VRRNRSIFYVSTYIHTYIHIWRDLTLIGVNTAPPPAADALGEGGTRGVKGAIGGVLVDDGGGGPELFRLGP